MLSKKTRKAEPSTSETLTDILASGSSNYVFPKKDRIAPGIYRSTVDSIAKSVTSKGNDAYDVCYNIASMNGRRKHRIVIRTAVSAPAFRSLAEALVAAGADPSTPLTEVSGIREIIELGYNYNDYAEIVKRRPASTETSVDDDVAADADTEEAVDDSDDYDDYDDFLDDED